MLVTDEGIVIFLMPLFENAPLSIVVAPFGTVRLVILLHPLNAPPPMILIAELSAIELFACGQIKSFV